MEIGKRGLIDHKLESNLSLSAWIKVQLISPIMAKSKVVGGVGFAVELLEFASGLCHLAAVWT